MNDHKKKKHLFVNNCGNETQTIESELLYTIGLEILFRFQPVDNQERTNTHVVDGVNYVNTVAMECYYLIKPVDENSAHIRG